MANRDLNSIFDYLAERSPAGLRTVMSRIDARVGSLKDNPLIAPSVLDGRARMLAITGTPYLVFYRVETEAVVVLRVMHGAQERPTDL
jgi:toxin ParE1/3/4